MSLPNDGILWHLHEDGRFHKKRVVVKRRDTGQQQVPNFVCALKAVSIVTRVSGKEIQFDPNTVLVQIVANDSATVAVPPTSGGTASLSSSFATEGDELFVSREGAPVSLDKIGVSLKDGTTAPKGDVKPPVTVVKTRQRSLSRRDSLIVTDEPSTFRVIVVAPLKPVPDYITSPIPLSSTGERVVYLRGRNKQDRNQWVSFFLSLKTTPQTPAETYPRGLCDTAEGPKEVLIPPLVGNEPTAPTATPTAPQAQTTSKAPDSANEAPEEQPPPRTPRSVRIVVEEKEKKAVEQTTATTASTSSPPVERHNAVMEAVRKECALMQQRAQARRAMDISLWSSATTPFAAAVLESGSDIVLDSSQALSQFLYSGVGCSEASRFLCLETSSPSVIPLTSCQWNRANQSLIFTSAVGILVQPRMEEMDDIICCGTETGDQRVVCFGHTFQCHCATSKPKCAVAADLLVSRMHAAVLVASVVPNLRRNQRTPFPPKFLLRVGLTERELMDGKLWVQEIWRRRLLRESLATTLQQTTTY